MAYQHHYPAQAPCHGISCSVHQGMLQIQPNSCRNVLYNMNSFLKKNWSIKPPTSCNCHQFLQQHPECRTTAHHVASPLSAFNLPHQLAKCLAYSANSQIYFRYQKYTKITTELVQKWLNHHNLQNVDISK